MLSIVVFLVAIVGEINLVDLPLFSYSRFCFRYSFAYNLSFFSTLSDLLLLVIDRKRIFVIGVCIP